MNQISEQNPTVSVCIPSYNHSRYIQRCLESIFAQTYLPTELIVIDDGSTDGSPNIIEKLLKKCPFRCELIVRPNKGPAATATEGLEKARGEIHVGMASDDIWLPQFLEKNVKLLVTRPEAVLAYCNCFLIDENDKIIGSSSDWENYGAKDTREMLLKMCCPQAPAVIFRKSAISALKWTGEYAEDLDLFLRLCLKGEFAFEPSILSGYRAHPENISRHTKQLIEGQIKAFRRNAAGLNLSDEDLTGLEERLKWESVNLYLGRSQRLDAVKTALKHSRTAAVPLTDKLRQYLKLILPYSVLQAGRKKIKRSSDQWIGLDIKDLIKEQLESGKSFRVA